MMPYFLSNPVVLDSTVKRLESHALLHFVLLIACWYTIAPGEAAAAKDPSPEGSMVKPRYREAMGASRKIVEAVRTNHGNRIPGISIAVFKDEQIVWSQAFGVVDVARHIRATRESRFRLASASKVLTASLCAKLAEKSRIDLDADVRRFVPSFPDKGHKITLRMLLGHLGCIRHYEGKDFQADTPGGRIDGRAYESSKDALAIFADDPLVCVPGEKYLYSTFGYTLISAALEGALDKPFEDILQAELLSPLKLESIGPDLLEERDASKTRFYQDDGKIVESGSVNCAYKLAGGGLLSTAADLARFGAAHFREGFFTQRTLDELFTLQKLPDGSASRAALGWRVGEDQDGRRIYHHAGSMPGARSIIVVYQAQRLAIAILTNVWSEPANIRKYAGEIAGHFLQIDGN